MLVADDLRDLRALRAAARGAGVPDRHDDPRRGHRRHDTAAAARQARGPGRLRPAGGPAQDEARALVLRLAARDHHGAAAAAGDGERDHVARGHQAGDVDADPALVADAPGLDALAAEAEARAVTLGPAYDEALARLPAHVEAQHRVCVPGGERVQAEAQDRDELARAAHLEPPRADEVALVVVGVARMRHRVVLDRRDADGVRIGRPGGPGHRQHEHNDPGEQGGTSEACGGRGRHQGVSRLDFPERIGYGPRPHPGAMRIAQLRVTKPVRRRPAGRARLDGRSRAGARGWPKRPAARAGPETRSDGFALPSTKRPNEEARCPRPGCRRPRRSGARSSRPSSTRCCAGRGPSGRSPAPTCTRRTPAIYRCAACGNELFSSDTKFDSGTGWPSFTEPPVAEAVETRRPTAPSGWCAPRCAARAAARTWATSSTTAPGPTGQRFCINSVALQLDPEQS